MKSVFVAFALGVLVGGGGVLLWQRDGGRVGSASAAQAAPARGPAGAPAPQGDVLINGHELTREQRQEFAQRYGVEPQAGDYWYDPRSGLWGHAGQSSAGFLLAGHAFGALSADASRGDTQVFINGRCVPQQEVLTFAALVGGVVLPGRYWLDGTGNYGYEGLDLPVGNLYATTANAGRGGAGGGDNFWSARFSAGNYNEDNSVGYVSVPGVGPVSYGM